MKMIKKILEFLIGVLNKYENRESLKTLGAARSSQWPKVRAEHLRRFPACALCGELKKNIEVHHIIPFSEDPSKELDPQNLLTLCESGNNGVVCHRFFGHHGNYRVSNPDVVSDVQKWHNKIANR